MGSTFRDILGIRTRIHDSQTQGKPVLLIHGLGGSIDSWGDSIDAIATRHRVLAIDLPGFGQSDKPKVNYSIRFYTDFVAHLIESGPNQVSIVGSSMGGQIAAEIAIKFPELVSKLILICPAGMPPFSFKGGGALHTYAKIAEARGEQDVKRILDLIDGRHVSEEYAKSVYQRISMPGAREAFIGALRESAKAPRLGKRVSKIRSPAMVLWGQNDKMIPPKYAAPFVGLENFRLVMIEHCGHRPHVDTPELFNNLILSFLEN